MELRKDKESKADNKTKVFFAVQPWGGETELRYPGPGTVVLSGKEERTGMCMERLTVRSLTLLHPLSML